MLREVPAHGRRRIDFAVINPASVGEASLRLNKLFEVKGNYAHQIDEIDRRVGEAVQQARQYAHAHGLTDEGTVVLYLIVAPAGPSSTAWTRM